MLVAVCAHQPSDVTSLPLGTRARAGFVGNAGCAAETFVLVASVDVNADGGY
jgi:hypothetical protein